MLSGDVGQLQSGSELDQAERILDQGGVVAIPTETVYGLAARVDRLEGLQKIFAVKNRPFFDPLIVHVDSVELARQYLADWNPLCTVLATQFWPGPLSLVGPKTAAVPDLITAGLSTVAVRIPKNGKTLELIHRAGVGLAAPSANRFGKTSPTESAHVKSEFSDVFVIHDEPAEIGIESTVLRVNGSQLRILRPGMISRAQIEAALDEANLFYSWDYSVVDVGGESPGQLKHHYMPDRPLIWVDGDMDLPAITRFANQHIDSIPDEIAGVPIQHVAKVEKGVELVLPTDPRLAARELYGKLRQCAEGEADFIFFRWQPSMQGDLWQAILDRLGKAASLRMSSGSLSFHDM